MSQSTLSEEEQREVTRLCVQTGLMLMQHGAESALVESTTRRLGLTLGARSVEVAIMANAITVTTLSGEQCITTVRRNEDRGINMHVVTEVHRSMLDAEAGRLDAAGVRLRLEAIEPLHYPRWIVVVMIGLSCACFARLAHADWTGCGMAFLASGAAMAARQQIGHLHFNPMVTFFAAAFVATSISGLSLRYGLGETPKIAMAASVLLLVPGFPLINCVSDMVKGYVNTGISRGMVACMLALASCGGIVLAMTVWHVWAWL